MSEHQDWVTVRRGSLHVMRDRMKMWIDNSAGHMENDVKRWIKTLSGMIASASPPPPSPPEGVLEQIARPTEDEFLGWLALAYRQDANDLDGPHFTRWNMQVAALWGFEFAKAEQIAAPEDGEQVAEWLETLDAFTLATAGGTMLNTLLDKFERSAALIRTQARQIAALQASAETPEAIGDEVVAMRRAVELARPLIDHCWEMVLNYTPPEGMKGHGDLEQIEGRADYQWACQVRDCRAALSALQQAGKPADGPSPEGEERMARALGQLSSLPQYIHAFELTLHEKFRDELRAMARAALAASRPLEGPPMSAQQQASLEPGMSQAEAECRGLA